MNECFNLKESRRRALLLGFLIAVFSCNLAFAQSPKGVVFEFEQQKIDLGKVKKGDVKKMQFHFTNVGDEAAHIELVSGCECTELDWSFDPINPGESSFVDVVFNSGQKEESGSVDIDINLKNTDPASGNPIFYILNYTFELVE